MVPLNLSTAVDRATCRALFEIVPGLDVGKLWKISSGNSEIDTCRDEFHITAGGIH